MDKLKAFFTNKWTQLALWLIIIACSMASLIIYEGAKESIFDCFNLAIGLFSVLVIIKQIKHE